MREITQHRQGKNIYEKEEFPRHILDNLNELGLINLAVPEEYGGTGVDTLTHVIVVEEISRGCCGIATSAGSNALASYAILLGGTNEQKQRFLTPLWKKEK